MGHTLAISCAPCKIQNPSEPQNTPQNTPRILSRNQNTKNTKIYKNRGFSYIFRIFFVFFFRILVSGEDSGCILGCILDFGDQRGFIFCTGGRRSQPYPQYSWDFPEEILEKFRKDPETLSERFLAFPSGVRLGSLKPYNSRHLRLPEHFQNSLPPSMAGDSSFFRSGSGEGLSELVMEFPAVLGVFLILDRTKRIIRTLRFGHAAQNASGFPVFLYSIVYEWIFGTRVLSTQPKTLSNTKEH